MNKRQLQKIKSVLTKAIKAHLKKGGKLIADDFYLDSAKSNDKELASKCRCPIQIVSDKQVGGQLQVCSSVLFSEALGFPISRDEMYAIIHGYDNRGMKNMKLWISLDEKSCKPLYAIGRELRKNYKPLTKPQINKIMGYDYVQS